MTAALEGWLVVSSTPRPHFTTGKYPVPILQEAGWAPGPVWTGGKPRPHRDSIPDRPACGSVPIPTELPGPPFQFYELLKLEWMNLFKFSSFIVGWNGDCNGFVYQLRGIEG